MVSIFRFFQSFREILNFFRFRIFYSETIYGNHFHYLIFDGPVRGIRSRFGNAVHHIHSLNDFSEGCITAIEMRGVFMHDKKLRTSGIRMHASCHGKDAFLMFQVIFNTVLGKFSFDTVAGAAHTGSFRIAALNHKTADDPVENKAVVKVPVD